MATNHNPILMRWQKACLAITVIFSVSDLVAISRRSEFLPAGIDAALPRGGANALLPIFIGLIILWSPLVCYWLGLRASSSVSASILGMMNFGAGFFGIFTPESSNLVAVALILLGVFYYFYSTKTWQIYEIYWFNEQRQKTAVK